MLNFPLSLTWSDKEPLSMWGLEQFLVTVHTVHGSPQDAQDLNPPRMRYSFSPERDFCLMTVPASSSPQSQTAHLVNSAAAILGILFQAI